MEIDGNMDADTEELVSCPYNAFHKIRQKKLAAHLYKCKKQHPHIRLAICDFNATHHIPEGELRYHHQHCPSRKKIEALIYQEEGNTTNQYPVHNIEVKTDENWDDFNVPTYNAEEYCMSHGVLRKLDGAPPSKKKEFQMQERERLKIVESPICDIVETCICDENVEKDEKAKREARIAALKNLIKKHGICKNSICVSNADEETNNNCKNNNHPPYAEATCAKLMHRDEDKNVICDQRDEPAKSEDNEDRLAVLKDLIRHGMKMPFMPKKSMLH